jgi:hypothetical protein
MILVITVEIDDAVCEAVVVGQDTDKVLLAEETVAELTNEIADHIRSAARRAGHS